ncbi:MAG: hypothetical protein MK135_03845, partial [Polyangiaceae bacterium]|nr:hypothetical protein [Polyangiaceae bacterium]
LASPDEGDDVEGPMMRLTPRGRSWLSESGAFQEKTAGKFMDNQTLRVGSDALLADILELSPLTEVGNVEGDLDLLITPRTLALAIGTGINPSVLRSRLEKIAELPDPIQRQLAQASTVLGRAEFVSSGGFLWIDDPEIRRMLSTRRATADLFVNPSPPSGLLVAPGVEMDTMARRCRTMGIEILADGEVCYASSTVATRRSRKSEAPVPPSQPPRSSRAPAMTEKDPPTTRRRASSAPKSNTAGAGASSAKSRTTAKKPASSARRVGATKASSKPAKPASRKTESKPAAKSGVTAKKAPRSRRNAASS